MKQLFISLILCTMALSCQVNDSSPDLKLIDSINDNALERLDKKYRNLGSHPFIEPVIENLRDSKLKCKEALEKGDWSGYAIALSKVSKELLKIRSFVPDSFFEAIGRTLNSEKKGSLLAIETHLISSAEEAFFNYFYHADVLSAYVDFPLTMTSSAKTVRGEIRLRTSMSTLKTLAAFDIIDLSTNKVEKHYELSSNAIGMLDFDYLGTNRGTKLIKGYLNVFDNGKTSEIPFEKEITVK